MSCPNILEFSTFLKHNSFNSDGCLQKTLLLKIFYLAPAT